MNPAALANERYELWRSQWLAATHCQAHSTLRWHGMAAALQQTAPARAAVAAGHARRLTVPPAPERTPALEEAARLLRASLRAGGGAPRA